MTDKPQKPNAATVYEVADDFKRFDQKQNIIMRMQWDEEIKKLEEVRKSNILKYVKEDKPGYSHFDYAVSQAALKFIEGINYGVNISDQGANSWNNDNPVEIEKWQGEKKELTQSIIKAAKIYGASAVGIASLDKRWFFSRWYDPNTKESHPIIFADEDKGFGNIKKPTVLKDGSKVIPGSMRTVIVFLFEMDYQCLQYAPTLLPYANSLDVYAKMTLATKCMAELIRSLGYEAIPSINCTALNIPLAIDAGLGQLGRNGKLIHPQLGPKCRISKVITDIPLMYNEPIDFGVTEFCEACRQCVKKCPVGAISSGPRKKTALNEVSNGGYLKWEVDHKKCFEYWSECGTNCNICLTVCSYNRGHKWTKSLLAAYEGSSTLVDRLLDSLEDDPNRSALGDSRDYWRTD